MLPLHHDPATSTSLQAARFRRSLLMIEPSPAVTFLVFVTCSPAPLLSCSILGREAAKSRDGRIRTGDLLLPRQADYQTFLHPVE